MSNGKKVELDKQLLKEYGFSVGSDMSESVAIAIDQEGNPLKYKDIEKTRHTMVFHCLDGGKEFMVVDHESPISLTQYDMFKVLFTDKE